jgi:hypothetical protein
MAETTIKAAFREIVFIRARRCASVHMKLE